MMKVMNDAGEEIEVYTAEEVTARVGEEVKKKDDEYAPKLKGLETELDEAKGALAARSGEFKKFRNLNEDQIKTLTEKDRIIYENGLLLQEERDKREKLEKDANEGLVDRTIRSKVGDNPKLIEKVKETWGLVNIESTTPEAAEQKTMMILGMLSVQTPDLVASVAGFGGGAYQPPKPSGSGTETFAETDAGKRGASELGLILETPKK